MAEVLEHVLLIERRIDTLIERHVATITPRSGPAQIIPGLDALIDSRRLLDRSRKITTGDAMQPRGGMELARIREALDESRTILLHTVERCDGLALESISIPHAAFGPMDLYQWIAFIGTHEARHAAQIREAATLLASADRAVDDSAQREQA